MFGATSELASVMEFGFYYRSLRVRLWAGIPSRCVTSQLGQLSPASLRGR